MAVAFPNIKPSGRSYAPGSYPQTEFRAQNGAVTVVRFGSRRVDAELSLEFRNITDSQTTAILQNYEAVNGRWDWVTFTSANGSVGAGSDLQRYLQETGGSGLRWRYAEPPAVQSVQPGLSTVQCRFIGVLDGA